MEVYIDDKKLVITTEPKTICFDLPIEVNNSLKNEIKLTIKIMKFSQTNKQKKHDQPIIVKI